MDGPDCPPPVAVEGDWTPDQTKTVRNKLQLYFQSKKKSSGGDCRVEVEDGAPRAAVFFQSEEVRQRVLEREDHEVTVDKQTIKLRLFSTTTPTNSDDVSDSSTDSKAQGSEVEPAAGAAASNTPDPGTVQSSAVVLENVSDNMCRDLLVMLVENVSGSEESSFSLEIIWESNRAVVAFHKPEDAERFLTVSQTSSKMQKHGLTARLLEAAKSVRVESLHPTVGKDMLDLYFEKNWIQPDKIIMIPNEQAAILSFTDPKVVETICRKKEYMIGSNPVKVYPYLESLATALYGKERPTWKMPDPVTEGVHHTVWKFLLMKKQLKNINDQMRPFFCSVDLDNPEAKLSPLPSFLRQKDLTAKHVENWGGVAQEAFRKLMSQYSAFECTANAPAWKAVEKEVRLVVKEDAYLVLDASRGALMVAGLENDIKRIKAPVENLVLKAMSQIERQTNGVSDVMKLSPAMFYILKQDGLQNVALGISPDMILSYDEEAQKLTISGLPAEVYKAKSWILERNVHMSKKQLNVPPGLLDFLRTVDSMDMSQDLFTSQGISAIYSTDSQGVLLLGSSDSILTEAESRMKMVLSVNTLDVEDEEVLKLHSWVDLNKQLLDAYNFSKKKTVDIQLHPKRRDKIIVAGFTTPVKEVSSHLREFIVNYSRIKETVRVESCAVVQFLDRKKSHDWSSIAKANHVTIHLDSERPRITIAGARIHVQKAKSCLLELTSTFFSDNLIVDKPGAKKYFQTNGSIFLSTIMTEFNCVVLLRPENQEEDEEEEVNYEREGGLCYCNVRTTSGVLVSVSRADICGFNVDAVVNAANEELQHIGGLALALLKAAGPELQRISNDYISKHGKLRPGDAIVTDACNLPCKYVVHAVGPRFSNSEKKTSVSRLKLAVKESLKQAEMTNCSSIALPAISSGVFGFPVELCAETIAQALREYCDSPRGTGSVTEIHLVDNNHNTVGLLAKAVNQEFLDLGPTMTEPQQGGGRAAWASGGHQRGRGRGRGGGGKGRGGNRGEFHEGQQDNRRGHSPRGHTTPGAYGGRGAHGGHGGHGGPGKLEQTTAEGLKIALCKGNIQDQKADVIVNTISENMNLSQGAVSKAILEAAGPSLQLAVRSEAGAATLQHGDMVITDGFKLACRKIFHTVCPFWDNRGGKAEEVLITIIRCCLEEAEKLKMTSLSFPAIGTGNLSFPRDVVSRVLLREIHSFSRSRTPHHLTHVAIVVHPSDQQTVDCFTREFKGQSGQRQVQHEPRTSNEPPAQKSQQPSGSFGRVSSPSLGVYRMVMGQLTLEVLSGDITKEASDVIINSSNAHFNLRSGVSKAILDSAGFNVEQEIANSLGNQPRPMILTSAGNLPSRCIIHVVGQNDPAKIKDMVYSVLKVCEENKFGSVAFPALGTGQGGVNPSAVADAMVGAVVEFVRKKHPGFVRSVKILIFQTAMIKEFHTSMKKRQGEEVEEKSIFTRIREGFTSLFTGSVEERSGADDLVLEGEEFEPTEFQLCADNKKDVTDAKRRIEQLILAEQAQRTITDKFISHLSQADFEQLRNLQRELTVSIRLDKGQEDKEPSIHLEGLTRDVHTAESAISNIIRRVERAENLRTKAMMLSALVEWQFQHPNGQMVAFDMYTNINLEEALVKKENVKIKVNSETFIADLQIRKAVSTDGQKQLELLRKDLKDDAALPGHWDDMQGDIVKLFPLTAGSTEYNDVETELTKTGLTPNIISIERVQNTTLWQSYQLLKKQLEVKNKHTNNEKLLFHGTGANSIDLINKQGFNRSYAGTHGAAIGNGSYFAVNPAYSARGYAKPDLSGHKRMYLARVLVGDYINGRSGMITPPAKGSGNAADLYDSVADNTSNPTIFVVFNDIQAYPEYLITFT